jgi:hypothetical protein
LTKPASPTPAHPPISSNEPGAEEQAREAAERFMGDNFGDDELSSEQHTELIRTLSLFYAAAIRQSAASAREKALSERDAELSMLRAVAQRFLLCRQRDDTTGEYRGWRISGPMSLNELHDDAIAALRGSQQPAQEEAVRFDFEAHLQRQRDFSEHTFGPGRQTKGVVDHIRKELAEIEDDPSDVSEWIDVVILGLDGAWRTGCSPAQIIDAIVAKQLKNESRRWPDWRSADPDMAIEHDRSHP